MSVLDINVTARELIIFVDGRSKFAQRARALDSLPWGKVAPSAEGHRGSALTGPSVAAVKDRLRITTRGSFG